MREGNLEAPTRHPIDWKNPEYWDADALDRELERVYDICHGCRRCVSLCNAFPTLFDLIDESSTMEVDGVAKADYIKVVDECYLCDLCYMTKCPYTPPHPWNVDFPHLMLRAKAAKYKRGGVSRAEKFLASTDTQGMFAGIPVVVQVANAVNHSTLGRKVLSSQFGVHKDAWIPTLADKKFRAQAKSAARSDAPVRDGERTPGKVLVFSTCYVNYNEPGIGMDLLAVLTHNDIAWEVVNKEKCCGMPKLELGDLDGVAEHAAANLPILARYAREGYAIVTAIPSCTLMFKQEIPLLLPESAEAKLVQQAMWDPFEYLVARHKDGLLKTDFKVELGAVSYHIPCHGRVQNVGRKTEELLKLLPGVQVNTVERCSGHAGTYGVKEVHHATAMKIGKPVFRSMAQGEPRFIASDCQLAGHHIEQGMREAAGGAVPELAHPISLVARAYGLATHP
ncbi:MAG: Fe-S oxidoreductase [Proteobacteria bacterium]|nr:Fe-S oxidoreductase [Pseudomonadota bacterium]